MNTIVCIVVKNARLRKTERRSGQEIVSLDTEYLPAGLAGHHRETDVCLNVRFKLARKHTCPEVTLYADVMSLWRLFEYIKAHYHLFV